MADALYGRSWYVIVGDLKVVGLRLKFKAEKSLVKDPNTLDLQIYNLAAATRAKMQSRGTEIVLVAGYKGTEQVIFSGKSRTIDHVRDGPSWATHVQCGDGEDSFRRFTSRSFAPGAAWSDVAKDIARDLMVNAGDALAKLGSGDFKGTFDTFLQGYTAHGPAVREFDRVMSAAGLEWSIQDEKLQILTKNKASDERAIVLSPGTGMVGSPDHGSPKNPKQPPLLKVKSLLQGGLRPGRAVEVRASKINGFYRCWKVTHEGDTHGPEWYTSIEAEPL